ncbi:MAG: ATP synthase subunit I [Proteobacteria bacterium]|nr:ATP synthase subunit I [Pseudomonadota bacterium]MBS0216902.1 ATP synthase subunit I [Pseudomonadota bacterium]
MLNPIAVGRRSALRATLIEFCTVGLFALLFLPFGGKGALAVLVGGGASALGHLLAARVALNGIVPARVAFAQVVLGSVLKWILLAAVLMVALRVGHLPPLPMLAGLVFGILMYLMSFHWQAKQQAARVNRDR